MEGIEKCVGVGLRAELQQVGYPPGRLSSEQITPITEIHAKLTGEVIERLLSCQCAMHSARIITGGVGNLVNKILGLQPECPPAIKILTLLVLVKQSHLIIELMENCFNDTNYEELSVNRLKVIFGNTFSNKAISKISKRKWLLNPPTLFCDGLHEHFRKDVVMPFNESEEPIGTGSYGKVYEVEIHPSYQRFVKEDPNNPVRFPPVD